MKRRSFLILGAGGVLPGAAAQDAPRIWRVAWVAPQGARDVHIPQIDVFRQRLAELGYVEGGNLQVRLFDADYGGPERFEQVVRRSVEWNPDVIRVNTTPNTRLVARMTSSIPVVFSRVNDPVEAGLVENPLQPGRNLTGVAVHQTALAIKRLELVRELLPGARRVALILDRSQRVFSDDSIARIRQVAGQLGFGLEEIDPSTLPGGLGDAYGKAASIRPDAVLALSANLRLQTPSRPRSDAQLPLEFEQRERIPVIAALGIEAVGRGALASLGSSMHHEVRIVADQVARIFQGEKPADMPIEWVHSIELGINLRAARHLGITVPKSILLRADKVVQ